MNRMTILFGVWIAIASLQIGRQELAVAAAGGRVYVLGGIAGPSVTATVEEYDPRTNQWRFVAPMPEPLHHQAAAVVGDQIYIIGGYRTLSFDATDTVYRYDWKNDAWSQVASLPAPRGALAAATIGGKIYAAGGAPGGSSLTMYDPATNRWTTLPSMPTAREHLAAETVGGKLYVAGGRGPANIAALEVFDPLTNAWSTLAPMPTARSGIAAVAIDGRIYVFGGEGNPRTSTGVFAENESYDVATNTWRTDAPMPSPRHGIGAAVIAGRAYIPGGAVLQGYGTTAIGDAFLAVTPPRRRAVAH